MLLKCYSVYDSKSENYSPPFFAPTRGIAIRMFTEVANDKSNNVGKYPDDFTLFEVGTFNQLTCVLQQFEAKASCGCALEYVNKLN